MSAAAVLGIDFGTATTLLAEQAGAGPVRVVPVGRGTRWLPSVARRAPGSAGLLVGEDAETGLGQVRSVKRAVTDRRTTLTVYGPEGPEEVEADAAITAILAELVERARQAGVLVGSAAQIRLGCPAMWDGAQRRRLLKLAIAAGIPVTEASLVDEPVAAGVAWLSHQYLAAGVRPQGRLLVFDMGGGTLDVAVLAVSGGPEPEVNVLASVGVPLAGDALDLAVARDIAAEMTANRIDVSMHPQPELAWALLERAAREAKVRLTGVPEHPIVLPRPLGYPQPVRYRVEQLEQAFGPQFTGAENVVVSALRTARLTGAAGASVVPGPRAVSREALVADVQYVLLAGGMSRIPYVAQRLQALLPQARLYADAGGAPEESVVAGLADAAGHDRVNLLRPGYDVVLEWDFGRQRRTLYEAFTPLYQPWQVYNGHSDLSYQRSLYPGDVPADGEGLLRVLSASGEPVPFDGGTAAGLPVRFGPQPIVFQLGTDGRLSLSDGAGSTVSLRLGTGRGVSPVSLAS